MSSEPVPLDAVSEWLAAAVPQIPVAGGVSVQRLAGGHSNLTYRLVDAAGTSWVLRRPPTGTALSTAHDMAREWRFLTALAATPVPVPAPVAYCADPGVIGAEFYLMTFVEGDVLDDAGSGHRLDPAVRRTAAFSLVDALAAVHAVDPDAVGLGDLRRRGGYVERQLRRWHRHVHAGSAADLTAVDVGHARLARWAAALPPSAQQVVHGDFRFGNVAVCPAGIVRAVFDWELAALGDPLADLGWLVASWGGDGPPPIVPGPDLAGGYPAAAELVARYVARRGDEAGDLAQLGGYVAFARWRVACIQAGVHARYAAGSMGAVEDETAARDRLTEMSVQAQAALDALDAGVSPVL